MDLENWGKKEFNADITEENNGRYGPCNFINFRDTVNRTKYKYFCMKLIRNIWSIYEVAEGNTDYSKLRIEDMSSDERCNYLNKWILYYIMKKHVPDHVISEIFGIAHKMISADHDSYKCQCDLLNNEFFDPYKIIKLLLLENNTNTILDILKNKHHHHYDACLKFVRDCANTYQKLKKDYCTSANRQDAKNVKTCAQLDIFKESYNTEIYEKLSIRENVPDLENFKMGIEEELLLEKEDPYNSVQSDLLSSSSQHNSTTGAVMTVGTGAGITAGTGAILLALYKFTPIGSWFHSGKGRKERMGNFLEDGPSEELFLNDPDYLKMNSDSMSYNVGYGSMENY